MVVYLTPSLHLVPYFIDSGLRSMLDPIGRSQVPAIGEGAGVGGTPAPLGGQGWFGQPVEYYWVPGCGKLRGGGKMGPNFMFSFGFFRLLILHIYEMCWLYLKFFPINI